jgi:hypothetical protein
MPIFIDITNRAALNQLLTSLHSETTANWGRLKAQNMIEHLTEVVEYTNGKRIAKLQFQKKKQHDKSNRRSILTLSYQNLQKVFCLTRLSM